MKKQFWGTGFGPLGYAALFIVIAIIIGVQNLPGVALLMVLMAMVCVLSFIYNYRLYFVTSNEFYVCTAWGTKVTNLLYEDVVKIYTLKGVETQTSVWGGTTYGDETVTLKIQLKDGEIFHMNLIDILQPNAFMETLTEAFNQHITLTR